MIRIHPSILTYSDELVIYDAPKFSIFEALTQMMVRGIEKCLNRLKKSIEKTPQLSVS